ncbi:MAG: hypothetical protein R2857_12535 [Vampirovibrionales bacterium]
MSGMLGPEGDAGLVQGGVDACPDNQPIARVLNLMLGACSRTARLPPKRNPPAEPVADIDQQLASLLASMERPGTGYRCPERSSWLGWISMVSWP